MTEPRRTILVAEDDTDTRDLVVRGLRRAGYDVVAAADGEEALRAAFQSRPALAVLDVAMPLLNGDEVTRRLRQNGATSSMPILLLTGRAQPGDIVSGLAAGADDYVSKPFSPRDLLERVESLLAR